MASVTFKIYKGSEFNGSGDDKSAWIPAYKEGQIIFVKEQKKIYLDFDGDRTCYTPSGLNYVGVMDSGFEPDEPNTWKLKGEPFTPNDLDVVVYGTKEYLFRDNGWHEIGDESSPEWN